MSFRDKNGSFTSSRDDDASAASQPVLHQGYQHQHYHHPASHHQQSGLIAADDVLKFAPLPNELADRQRLMHHISLLTSHVQRLQLQINASDIHVPEDVLRSFDPVISELQIRRLDDLLAQQSLMREADRAKLTRLEHEAGRLLQERSALMDHIAALEQRVEGEGALHDELARRDETIRMMEREVDQLRRTEDRLSHELLRSRQLADDQPYSVHVQRPQDSWRQQRDDGCSDHVTMYETKDVEVGEAVARLGLVASMLFEPLAVALEAGIIWNEELARLKASPNGTTSPHPQLPDDTRSENGAHNISQQQLLHEALLSRGEFEVQRQKVLFTNMQLERAERLLEAERQRCDQLAASHRRELEELTAEVAKERQHILDRLVPDVEQQLRHAYREGRLFERNKRREKRRLNGGVVADSPSQQRLLPTAAAASGAAADEDDGHLSQPSTVPSMDEDDNGDPLNGRGHKSEDLL